MSAALYLDALYGAEPAGALIEVRYKRPGGMGQIFHAVEERRTLLRLTERLGRESDTYIGVAPRKRREGRRDAVENVHALYVDCDEPGAVGALEGFAPTPSIIVDSGRGRHAYWPLWPPAGPAEAERANRRLAHALGADMAATDAARILRPPGTLNHKTDPPTAVELEHLAVDLFKLEQVVGHLPDPAQPRREHRDVPRVSGDDPLLSIPPAVYVEALTGHEVGRDGKMSCPFHEDRTPSLHAYPSAEQGWTCFAGCGGGTIIDFGALLYGLEPRGSGFHEIRRRLLDALLVEAAA